MRPTCICARAAAARFNVKSACAFLAALATTLLPVACSHFPKYRVNDPKPLVAAAACDHRSWDELVQRHVGEDGLVDYVGLRRERAALDAYLARLAGVDVQALAGDDERKAYWINAYNAITVAGVLRHYPLRSVRDLAGFWTQTTAVCGGREVSLDQIEHEILRAMGDPRIHMAINCASTSCPLLAREAYTGKDVDQQLDEASARFLGDPSRNHFDRAQQRADLSMIFSWFASDFDVAPYGGVRGFLRRHATTLPWSDDRYELAYKSYDWSLNEGPRSP